MSQMKTCFPTSASSARSPSSSNHCKEFHQSDSWHLVCDCGCFLTNSLYFHHLPNCNLSVSLLTCCVLSCFFFVFAHGPWCCRSSVPGLFEPQGASFQVLLVLASGPEGVKHLLGRNVPLRGHPQTCRGRIP